MQSWKRVLVVVSVASLLVFAAALTWRLTLGRERSDPPPSAAIQATPEALPPYPVPTDTPPAPEPTETKVDSDPSYLLRVPLLKGYPPPDPTATETPRPTSTPTPLPSPTPTPTIPWPEAIPAPGDSKLGLHVQWNNSPEIMEFIRRMKPRVLKPVGDLGFVAEAKEASPETIVVARIMHEQPMEGDPEQMARDFVARHLTTYQTYPAVDYWEGYNEPDVSGRMEWYARFEAERVRAMARHGFRTAVGAFSTGVPEWEDFAAFLPAIEAAKQHGGILTLHEYDAPVMDRSAGAGLPGHPNHPDRGALTLRYRWWYEDFLKPMGLVIPLVISEAGVDGLVTNRPGPPDARGWLDFAGYWKEQGLGGNPLEIYIEQLLWYDQQLQDDDYVVGMAVFTVGAMNPDWQSYDVTDYLRHLAHDVIVPQAR